MIKEICCSLSRSRIILQLVACLISRKFASCPFEDLFPVNNPWIAKSYRCYVNGLVILCQTPKFHYMGDTCGGRNCEMRKQLQTLDLKVRMDCEGCELKVKKALSCMKGYGLYVGVDSVGINRKQNKVTVTGYFEPQKVLKKIQSTGKKTEIWPYVPYNLATQAHGAQTYDKKTPPGLVRNVEVLTASSLPARQDDILTNLFSDENPNACAVM